MSHGFCVPTKLRAPAVVMIACVIGLLVPALCHGAKRAIAVTIDHATDNDGTVAKIALAKGDTVKIQVIKTEKRCFAFNLKNLVSAVKSPPPLAFADTVDFPPQVYDGEVGYRVEAKLLDTLDDATKKACTDKRAERTWLIEVEHETWNLAITGAFTLDDLTDPVYFLEAGTRTVSDGQGGQTIESGYVVRHNPDAENDYTLGAAAMVHLFHERWGGTVVKWAPVSFGLGVSGESEARYFLGTSARFGDKLYLTGGAVFGSVATLPASLTVGSFTRDQNALGTLGSRTDQGWFLAVSLSLADVDLASFFKKPFAQPAPANPAGS